MTSLLQSLRALTSPHALAVELFEARLDARRGGSPAPEPAAVTWLDAHLAGCPACRERCARREQVLRALWGEPALEAPAGFAARVGARAAERQRQGLGGVAPRSKPHAEPAPAPWGWRGGVPLGSLALAGVVAGVFVLGPRLERGILPPSGADSAPVPGAVEGLASANLGGTSSGDADAPNFVIRAPGQGAARVRTVVSEVLEAHGGEASLVEGALRVVLPRDAYVAFLADLERLGGFKVHLGAEPGERAESVVLRVELD